MRRDLVLVLLIALAAFGIRTYPAWNSVYGGEGIGFLETDAWYHVRLVENQVRNFPWRVTLDPYAAPGGQFVPIAPLFDTITASVVVLAHGRQADTADVERIAAVMPPLLGTMAVIVAWALGARLFDRRAGLLAACLLAVLPGHFLDRTMLGFVDHHALEALLALATLLAFTVALSRPSRIAPFTAGATLGLYLLAWGSGAFLVGIIGVWLVVAVLSAGDDGARAEIGRVSAIAALTALTLVAAFQDPAMHRYGSQILGLTGLAAVAFATTLARGPRKRQVIVGMVVVLAVAAAVIVTLAGPLVAQLLTDLGRFAPDPTRMGVLEARPLFLYAGEWRWSQPWTFFRTGFFVGAIALVLFAGHAWRARRPAELLLFMYGVAVFAATVGQNRFGYYLITACAVLGGWLAARVLDWGGVPHRDDPAPTPWTRLPLAREIAVVTVAGGMFAPNLAPGLLLADRAKTMADYWRETMTFLGSSTPPPFAKSIDAGDEYYYARYADAHVPAPDYAIMNWWDQGYWIVQRARRVPVANPTQERAPNSARFYAETDERRAMALLRAEHVRYVVSDWELPFRRTNGTIMGRFQNVVDWAGGTHAEYYEVLYQRDPDGWTPVWIFREPYYRSMAYQLSVLGGSGVTPADQTTVITTAIRMDGNGLRFRELLSQQTYATYDAARQAIAASGADREIVGLDPWRSAFPILPLGGLALIFDARTPGQQPTESPWVRVFEVRERVPE